MLAVKLRLMIGSDPVESPTILVYTGAGEIEELATRVLYVLYSVCHLFNRCMPRENVIWGIVKEELLGMLNI